MLLIKHLTSNNMHCNPILPTDYFAFEMNEHTNQARWDSFRKADKESNTPAQPALVDTSKWIEATNLLRGAYRSGRELKKQKKYKIGFKRKHPELFFNVAEAIVLR